MHAGRTVLTATLAVALSACGGAGSPPPTSGGPTNPTPPVAACGLTAKMDFADQVLNEWYLFPTLLDSSVNRASFNELQPYLDARVAPARAQNKDRGFTYATSIAEENALINSGSSAGFGIRLTYDTVNNRVYVVEAFESAPGFAAGIDRGTELLAIGTNSSTLQTVSSLMASGGPQAVVNALGPSDPGLTRVLRFARADGSVTETSVSKADYALDPISDRYGAQILVDGGKKVGYINLRTFIVSNASQQLRDAFADFRSQGVTELIIDFRYNGGGLVSVANTFGDLMGRDRVGQIWSKTVLRPSKASENSTRLFGNEPNAIKPTKIAFIGRGGTASASELVINSMLPYIAPANIALVGADTFGKPVGQFGFDLAECDLRLRALAFKTVNANDQGEYFSGLASVMPNTCRAADDIFTQLGEPNEASIAAALDFLGGRSCTPISAGTGQRAQGVGGREALQPARPNAAQHEMPGLF